MKTKLTSAKCDAISDEDPRKTDHVHVWFLRNGKAFNHCIVPSRWLLSEFRVVD